MAARCEDAVWAGTLEVFELYVTEGGRVTSRGAHRIHPVQTYGLLACAARPRAIGLETPPLLLGVRRPLGGIWRERSRPVQMRKKPFVALSSEAPTCGGESPTRRSHGSDLWTAHKSDLSRTTSPTS